MKKSITFFAIITLFSINLNAQCIIDLGPDVMACPNNPVILNAGSGFTSYLWSTSETTQTIFVMNPGIYAVTVTDSLSNTCSDSVYINIAPPMTVSLNCVNATCSSCSDGSITATVTGGSPPYTFNWPNGVSGSTNFVNFLTPGFYTVTIIDGFGCSVVESCAIYSSNIGTGPFQISGTIYLDLDSNGIQGITENGIPYKKVNLLPDNLITYTDPSGNYTFLADSGVHTVSIELDSTWSISSDSLFYTINATNGNYPDNDFGIKSSSSGIITCELSSSIPRCGAIVSYYINATQYAFTNTHTVFKLVIDTATTYINSLPPITAINGDTLIWEYTDSIGYSTPNITLYLQLPSTIGYAFYTYLEATIFDSANVILNASSDTISQTIICSFDPNDKAVEPVGLGAQHLTFLDQTPTLEYFIRFQNTGTDTAFQVIINDELDLNLEISTFEYIGSSHPVSITILDHMAEFRFSNILLPDSNVNEPGSHGFIRFRCNPILQSSSYVLQNSADIYFDANSAIVTNTVFNTITLSTSLNELVYQENGLLIFPNPFDKSTTIKFTNDNHTTFDLSVYDVTGRLVRNQTSNDNFFIVEKNHLGSGIYFLRIKNSVNESVLQGKFIIN